MRNSSCRKDKDDPFLWLDTWNKSTASPRFGAKYGEVHIGLPPVYNRVRLLAGSLSPLLAGHDNLKDRLAMISWTKKKFDIYGWKLGNKKA
jgi:hypothetical protein